MLESVQNQTNTNKELLEVQSQLLEARKLVSQLQKDNEALRMQVMCRLCSFLNTLGLYIFPFQERISEATESDLDMIMKVTN